MKALVRLGQASNGVPIFTIAGQSVEFSRPFGAVWSREQQLWMYPAYYPAASKVLTDLATAFPGIQFEFSLAAQQHIQALTEVARKYAARELPSGFVYVTQPFDHQVEGLCHVYYLLRAALFYAPGLGKSKIAIDLLRLLHFLGYKAPAVVLGPLVTIRNWGREIDKHSGGQLRWKAVLGTRTQKRDIIEAAGSGECDVLLVTYDTARNFIDLINEKVPYRTVIADESQRIKDYRSLCTKAALEISQKASRKIIMTGTPTLGSPMDLYGQFKFLGDCFMPENYIKYKNKFLRTAGPNSHVILGYKNLDLLNARTQFLSIRKTKEECLDLPPQTIVDVEFELTRHQSVLYNQLVAEMGVNLANLIATLGGAASITDALPPDSVLPHAATLLNKLLQVSSGFLITNETLALCDTCEPGGCRHRYTCIPVGIKPGTPSCAVSVERLPDRLTVFEQNPKLEALVELLDDTLGDVSNKVIIWCYYRVELNIIEQQLQKMELGYVRVDGTTGEKIQGLADQFNEDPKIRVYLAQISTGVGITLNAAAYMVYYSLTYSLGAYLQSLDRNYRIGQCKNVTVWRLRGKQTIEGSILRLLDNKVEVDAVLATNLACMFCARSIPCAAENNTLFDKTCIYQRKMVRPVVRAQFIEIEAKP